MLLSMLVLCGMALAGWPDLGTPPMASRDGARDAAVIIAIEDYVFVSDISGARRNATDWYLYLTKGRGLSPDRVQLLLNQDATDASIRMAAERAAGAAQAGGTVWFVYIGHGAPSKQGDDGLLVGADAQGSAVGIYSRSVSQGEVLDLLGKGKQSKTVAIMDACFSGRTSTGEALVADLQPLIPVSQRQSEEAIVLSAASADQFAGPLPGDKRPAFSYLVLGAMRGWGDANQDGVVGAGEAIAFANQALLATVQGREQQPQLASGAPDTVLASGDEPGPDLAELNLLLRGLPLPKAAAPAPPRAEASTAAPTGTPVRVRGDARDVTLVNFGGSFPVPGAVPPGTYGIRATFDGEEMRVGQVVVGTDEVVIACDGAFTMCTTSQP